MKFSEKDLCSGNVDMLENILLEGKATLVLAWTMVNTNTDVSDALEAIDDYIKDILVAIEGEK